MSNVTTFEVTGDWRHIVDDGMVDLDAEPDEVRVTGKVTFTPVWPTVATAGVPAIAYTLGPVTALIANGVLTDLQGRPGVRLAAKIGDHKVRWTASTELRYQLQKLNYPKVDFELDSDVRLTGIIQQTAPGLKPIVLDPRVEALAGRLADVDGIITQAEDIVSAAEQSVVLAREEADRAVGLANAQDEHIADTLEDPDSATHAAFKAVGNATYAGKGVQAEVEGRLSAPQLAATVGQQIATTSAPLPPLDLTGLGRPMALVPDVSQPSGFRWEILANAELAPIKPSGNITWTNTALSLVPQSIGIDGAVYGGLDSNVLGTWRSSDPVLASRETGYTFTGETGFAVIFLTATSSGFMAILANNSTGVTKIWHSNQWGTGWSVVHTMGRVSASVSIGRPTQDADGNTVVTVGEYVTGSYPSAQMKLFVTADGGMTFHEIKKTKLVDSSINSHWHGSCLDPDRDRLWAANGDGLNSWFGYCDDWRTVLTGGSPTWVGVPMDPDHPLHDGIEYQQPTLVAYMGERLALTPDRGSFPSGIWVANPDTGLTGGNYNLPSGEATFNQYGLMRHAYDGNKIAYVAFPDTAPGAGSKKTYIVGTGDGGATWHLVSTVDTATGTLSGGIVGPGPGGRLYAKGFNLATYGSGIMIGTQPTWAR